MMTSRIIGNHEKIPKQSTAPNRNAQPTRLSVSLRRRPPRRLRPTDPAAGPESATLGMTEVTAIVCSPGWSWDRYIGTERDAGAGRTDPRSRGDSGSVGDQ